jgi:prolyl-tRNA editing enzyme YbaK/EbsC (Cys-tRNA(Pro) deacylase)
MGQQAGPVEEPNSSRAVRTVEEAARAAGLAIVVVQYSDTTRTAEDAAAAIGCDVAQIVKSLVFSVRGGGAPVARGDPAGDTLAASPAMDDTLAASPAMDDTLAASPAMDDTAAGFATGDGPAGEVVLALVSGENQLDERQLARAAGATGRARRVDADTVRAVTGFAIGGVPPFGHATPLRCFVDRRLLRHDELWAAAGTPHAVFAVAPEQLVRIAGGEVAELARR